MKLAIYRILLVIFSLAMLASAAAKLTQQPMLLEAFTKLGYPAYLMIMLGVAYALGVIALWQKVFRFVQEWAFAGFFIALIGAIASHLAVKDPIMAVIPAVVLLALLVVIYLLRSGIRR